MSARPIGTRMATLYRSNGNLKEDYAVTRGGPRAGMEANVRDERAGTCVNDRSTPRCGSALMTHETSAGVGPATIVRHATQRLGSCDP
jgi:hypothetical protein